MDRFFTRFDPTSKETWINDAEAHHMLDVKRLKVGNKVSLFNGTGYECIGEIIDICQERPPHHKRVKIAIHEIKNINREINVDITMAFSAPKGKYSDLIIQKCAELGVKKIIPLITERSVVRIDHSSGKKLEKWRRIAIEASKQCGRNLITEICDVMSFDSLIRLISSHKLSIIFTHEPEIQGIKDTLKNYHGIDNILCIIGPEGGFSNEEIKRGVKMGCVPARLTPQILRVETAVITVVAMLVYEYSA